MTANILGSDPRVFPIMHLRPELSPSPGCPFCSGTCRYAYRMGEYEVWVCRRCGTGQTYPRPNPEELREFYRGFLFAAKRGNYPLVKRTAGELFGYAGLTPGRGLGMLDAGGGGGFYARAFEELGYGRSTYVDLDPEACEFARALGVDTVVQADIEDPDTLRETYDFVLCRHLLEHLLEPTEFILHLVDKLRPGGSLLLVSPNGRSMEYLAYPFSNLRGRLASVLRSNPRGVQKVLGMLAGRQMLHGMDPPRHLWAFSGSGLELFLERQGLTHRIESFPLGDPVFSPFVRHRWQLRPFLFLGAHLLARWRGGTHLTCLVTVPPR